MTTEIEKPKLEAGMELYSGIVDRLQADIKYHTTVASQYALQFVSGGKDGDKVNSKIHLAQVQTLEAVAELISANRMIFANLVAKLEPGIKSK